MNKEKWTAMEYALMKLKIDLKIMGIRYGHAVDRDRKLCEEDCIGSQGPQRSALLEKK
jgi:hypothetical protein